MDMPRTGAPSHSLPHTKLLEWDILIEAETRAWRALFRASKFGNMVGLAYTCSNRALISAFVERWQSETNTFHMPFGEMIITLDDVSCLTGLIVKGHVMSSVPDDVDDAKIEDYADLVVRLLGVTYTDAKMEIETARGSSEWIYEHFPCFRPSQNTNYEDNKYARAMRWLPSSRNTARMDLLYRCSGASSTLRYSLVIPTTPIGLNLASSPGASQSYNLVWSDDLKDHFND
ncbi:hypothetical protein ACS0TY_024014 [Phlomoides rotata]